MFRYFHGIEFRCKPGDRAEPKDYYLSCAIIFDRSSGYPVVLRKRTSRILKFGVSPEGKKKQNQDYIVGWCVIMLIVCARECDQDSKTEVVVCHVVGAIYFPVRLKYCGREGS